MSSDDTPVTPGDKPGADDDASDYGNPFENPDLDAENADDAAHASDDPGRAYEGPPAEAETHPRSGTSAPSAPRRSGMGERQAPRRESEGGLAHADPVIPGEVLYGTGDLELNAGMEVTTVHVENHADRPIQIGSHFHFAEVNAALDFDRNAAWGKRLNVLSGGAMRFEPGASEEVELVPITGQRVVYGLRNLCGGSLDG